MRTLSEIKESYNKIERVADSVGRMLGVKKLRVSQQLKLNELTPLLDGSSTLTTPDGTKLEMPRRTYPMLAASVVEMNGNPITFPKTRGELDSMIDELDEPGLLAVVAALAKLGSDAEEIEGVAALDSDELAKK